MTPPGCGLEDFLALSWFVYMGIKWQGRRNSDFLEIQCKIFIEVRAAGECSPRKVEVVGAFPQHTRMGRAWVQGQCLFYRRRLTFSTSWCVSSLWLFLGWTWGRTKSRDRGTRQVLQQQGRKQRSQSLVGEYLVICFMWLVDVCTGMEM